MRLFEHRLINIAAAFYSELLGKMALGEQKDQRK